MNGSCLKAISFGLLDLPLHTPFGISSGSLEIAQNLLLRVELADGSWGLGEAAPFPAASGETRQDVLEVLPELPSLLLGQDARRRGPLAAALRELCMQRRRPVPSLRVAVELALVDAWSRRAGLPLWALYGGAELSLQTDITLVTGSAEVSALAAARHQAQGFSFLKVKVGALELEQELQRLRAILASAPEVRLRLDANCAYTAEQACTLIRELGALRHRIELFEQPVAAEDWDGLEEVEKKTGLVVVADESARSLEQVQRLISERRCSGVNIKTAKTGLDESERIARLCRAHELRLMIGGMVESELSMSASACLAAGLGGFSYVDLDTPFFMAERPLSGGFGLAGDCLKLEPIQAGHGVRCLGDLADFDSWSKL